MPVDFDVSKLSTDEYKRYIYKGKRGTRDMSLEGYKYAIKPYLVGTEVKSIQIVPATINSVRKVHFERVSDDPEENGREENSGPQMYSGLWVSAVVGIKVKNGDVIETYEATGEANFRELARKGTEDALVRIAESRAMKRACAKALGISPVSFFSDPGRKSYMEDTDTPMADLMDEEASGRKYHSDQGAREPKVTLNDIAD